jgi:hypothetical protein
MRVPFLHNLDHDQSVAIADILRSIDLGLILRSLRLGHNRSNLIGPANFSLESLPEISANIASLTILATCAHTFRPAVFLSRNMLLRTPLRNGYAGTDLALAS